MTTKESEGYFFHQCCKKVATNTVIVAWLAGYIIQLLLFDSHSSLVYFRGIKMQFSPQNAPQCLTKWYDLICTLMIAVQRNVQIQKQWHCTERWNHCNASQHCGEFWQGSHCEFKQTRPGNLCGDNQGIFLYWNNLIHGLKLLWSLQLQKWLTFVVLQPKKNQCWLQKCKKFTL